MIDILVCFIIILILQLLTPFWFWIMIIPFCYAFLRSRSGWKGFANGAISGGLVWLCGSLFYWINFSEIIADRIAVMIKIGSPWILVLITSLIAIVAGGFGGASGGLLKKAIGLTK